MNTLTAQEVFTETGLTPRELLTALSEARMELNRRSFID